MAAPDPLTHERVYRYLRAGILAGHIGPGTKLTASDLAKAVQASVTPVREAMYRLVGEGLVSATHDGFHASIVDDEMLLDILDVSQKLLLIGLQRLSQYRLPALVRDNRGEKPDAAEAVKIVEAVLDHLFRATGNKAIIRWGQSANERLHLLRLAYCGGSDRARQHSLVLHELAVGHDRTRLARQILAHHRQLGRAITIHNMAAKLRFGSRIG